MANKKKSVFICDIDNTVTRNMYSEQVACSKAGESIHELHKEALLNFEFNTHTIKSITEQILHSGCNDVGFIFITRNKEHSLTDKKDWPTLISGSNTYNVAIHEFVARIIRGIKLSENKFGLVEVLGMYRSCDYGYYMPDKTRMIQDAILSEYLNDFNTSDGDDEFGIYYYDDDLSQIKPAKSMFDSIIENKRRHQVKLFCVGINNAFEYRKCKVDLEFQDVDFSMETLNSLRVNNTDERTKQETIMEISKVILKQKELVYGSYMKNVLSGNYSNQVVHTKLFFDFERKYVRFRNLFIEAENFGGAKIDTVYDTLMDMICYGVLIMQTIMELNDDDIGSYL